jgi:hypothetical protein
MRLTETEWVSTVKNSKAPFIWVPIIGLGEYLQEGLQSRPIGNQISVIPMTPNCIGGFDGSEGKVPYIVKGKKCTFAFAIGEPGNTKLTVLKKFEIDGRVTSSTITCVKGKLTKKVTSLKPKCPTGYKKKQP